VATTRLVPELIASVGALHEAPPANRRQAAEAVVAKVAEGLHTPARVSLRSLERELEERVDLETLLATVLASKALLELRARQVEETLESLRAQLRQMPGTQPEGMLWNFTRLKAEKTLIAAERQRRG
jgi:hypothetical protein